MPIGDDPCLVIIGDDEIRNRCQIGIPVVSESSFPVH